MPQYRHEWKHAINLADRIAIRQRLRAVAQPDEHARDGRYWIRSLYFDNLADKALREKIDGVNRREKFRIRYYNGDVSLLHLEKKSKLSTVWERSTKRPSLPPKPRQSPTANGTGCQPAAGRWYRSCTAR